MSKLQSSKKLIDLLGILLEPERHKLKCNEKELFEIARINKIAYFYLMRLNEFTHLSWVREKLTEMEPRAKAFEDALIDVKEALEHIGIQYAIFKTVKPFYFLPNDIDVLIFGDKRDLIEASLSIKDFGFKLSKNEEPYSITARSPSGYLVELYQEPSISYFIYLDKDKIRVLLKDLQHNALFFRMLSDEGEIISVASHSIFKEQILTLADILDFVFRTNNKSFNYKLMALLATSCGVDLGLKLAFNTALRILNETDYKWICSGLNNATNALKVSHPLTKAYIRKISLNNDLPIKYPLFSLVPPFTRLLEKSHKARISLLRQIVGFSKIKSYHMKILGSLALLRLKRDTY